MYHITFKLKNQLTYSTQTHYKHNEIFQPPQKKKLPNLSSFHSKTIFCVLMHSSKRRLHR
jgi:hypothetical protein